MLGLTGPIAAFAAGPLTVDLLSVGTNSFVILTKTGVTDANLSVVTGNVGSYPISGSATLVTCAEVAGTIYSRDAAGPLPCRVTNDPLLLSATNDMVTAYNEAAGRPTPDGTNLYAGSIGGQTFVPGLYKWTTDVNIATSITLNGGINDVWIFQMTGDLSIASGPSVPAGIKVLLTGGARAENVFWQVGGGTGATLGTYSTFTGTILSAKQVILQTGAVLNGRALAQTQVTLDANTVTLPLPPVAATLRVIKVVSGGAAVVSDFTVHVKSATSTLDVSGSPAAGAATPGTAYVLAAGTYNVSENVDPSYTPAFSGDCNASGSITLAEGADKTCTITNVNIPPTPSQGQSNRALRCNPATQSVAVNQTATFTAIGGNNVFIWDASGASPATIGGSNTFDASYATAGTKQINVTSSGQSVACTLYVVAAPVPPLLSIIKVPTPLALPLGPGLVTYDLTVANIGEVAISNVVVIDNQCSAVSFISGDLNSNNLLDTNESWKYRCSMTLTQTTTNTATATGQANGLTALDTANATVVVSAPVVPPLIHVVKKPDVFVLPAGGGAVLYTYTVTNPGVAPLSNVFIADDKCTGLPGRVVGHPGDLNQNDLLESNEAWTFTCQTNLTQTTTNIGTASGSANGFTATDASPVTVVVAPPGLPNTGFGPTSMQWDITILTGMLAAAYSFFAGKKKTV